jgi:hypothetical protein
MATRQQTHINSGRRGLMWLCTHSSAHHFPIAAHSHYELTLFDDQAFPPKKSLHIPTDEWSTQ